MTRKRILWVTVPILWAATPGCTWVRLEPEAELVRVRAAGDVTGCERLGKTGTRTAAKVGPFGRREKNVREELERLARNEAVEMGGNTIAPLEDMAGGEQNFGIYRCQ